jgi:3-isopropylmalate/(R)-2-methylmalate dehydratase small subunit
MLFVNKNFGCGSSREHAPQALYRFGIQAIVGESFAAIFAGNCTIMGVPTVTVSAKEMEQLMKSVEEDPRTQYTVDLKSKTLSYGNRKIAIDLPETYRKALTTGSWDSTGLLRGNLEQVRRTASKLPYMSQFAS